jgi:hypothetical protein
MVYPKLDARRFQYFAAITTFHSSRNLLSVATDRRFQRFCGRGFVLAGGFTPSYKV